MACITCTSGPRDRGPPFVARQLLAVASAGAQAVGPIPPTLHAQAIGTATPGPYAGQQHSAIRGLTEAEIEAFRSGAGMGLARPGELNGYPGPLHVLELADALGLSDEQRAAVHALREQMKTEAVPRGERFLDLYAGLEHAFRDGSITMETLAAWTAEIGSVEGELRATHLRYHLLTKPLLTDHQLATYARLRGYTDDPTIPHHLPGRHGSRRP